MSSAVRQLEPKSLWNNFANINAIPRASKKEEEIIAYMVKFGEDLGLATMTDHIGNVIIKKPATAGMEDRKTIVLQSHLDMVHQKNNDTVFDFATEGIKMIIADDWVKADGTTLGADNGIGVATIMALLESTDIAHPQLEALFTIDEETGMTGALELKGGLLEADIMLNLDTEDDHELTIGCAGGVDITASGKYEEEDAPAGHTAYKITIKGLNGGHSGMDIHKGLGNANKISNRLLFELQKVTDIRLASVDGGSLRNAIPRESVVTLVVSPDDVQIFKAKFEELRNIINAEHSTTDSNLTIELAETEVTKVLSKPFQTQILTAIYSTQNGIYRMSPDIDGLVQTSNNLARVLIGEGAYQVLCLTRSSVDSEKADLVNMISGVYNLIGAEVTTSGEYPGWTPRPQSDIVSIMADLYRKMFDGEPDVNACHAGLECGILGTNYPSMEMISFGPNIRGAHSPDEKVQISSVQKYWKYLLETLKQIPARG